MLSYVNKVESAEDLWQAGYHRPVAGRIIIEFKEWRCHQFVVSGDREERLLGKLDDVEALVLLRPATVGGDVGVLRSLEVGTPPVGHNVLHCPLWGEGRGRQ